MAQRAHFSAALRQWLRWLGLAGMLGLWLVLPAQAREVSILVLGDSLSAEYGLARGSGWVALLEKKLASQGITATVRNASISGETTAGGAARLGPLLADKPRHVVIELGGNDALRGLSLTGTQANLERMVRTAKRAGAQVLLLGMQVPPNYGKDYSAQFAAMYVQVARQEKVGLVPFFLKGVAEQERLFQPDRIHPTAQAQPMLLENVWPELSKQL